MRLCSRNTFKGFNYERRRREEGGPHPRAPMMVNEGEEGMEMMVEGGVILNHKGNHHASKFQSSKEKMTQTSTLSGNKKWTKFLPIM